MKRFFITFIILFLNVHVFGQPGNINNIIVEQRDDGTGYVDIHFDLIGFGNDVFDITLKVSFDGGDTYSLIQSQHLSGALESVAPIPGLHIEWNGMASHPNVYTEEAILKIIADISGEGLPPNTVMDIDGNLYPTITINEQEWMAANLRVTRYNDGTPIPTGLSDEEWGDDTEGAYSIYPHELIDGIDSDEEMVDAYGKLYNFFAFFNNPDKFCPPGWRVPSTDDWRGLVNPLGGQDAAGAFMKSTATEPDPHPRWDQPNLGANNETGFSGVPSGERAPAGNYRRLGQYGMYYGTDFDYSDGQIRPRGYRLEYETVRARRYILNANTGYPVRCMRDEHTGPVELGEGYYDGPYIIYEGDEVRIISVVPGDDGNAELIDERMPFDQMPETITVYPNQKRLGTEDRLPPFDVTLWDFEAELQYEFEQPDEMFVVSDHHGSFTTFYEILLAGNVIDEDYNWTFGDNFLVYIGDVPSRGDDQTPIFWLLYKLQYEANQAGGEVIYTIGNHEAMHLAGDLRYLHSKYHNFLDYTGIDYSEELFGENSLLGSWIRTKNTIVRIGRHLVVHGGIFPDFVAEEYTIPEANNLIRQYLGTPNSMLPPRPYFLFRTWGPLWYRGMALTDPDRLPIFGEEIDALLNHFDVDKFLIGHNHHIMVRYHRDYTVLCTASYPHMNAHANNRSQGLLISKEPDESYSYRGVYDDGTTRRLPLWE